MGSGGAIGNSADAIAWYVYPLPPGMGRKFGDGIATIILATGISAVVGFVIGLVAAEFAYLILALWRALALRW